MTLKEEARRVAQLYSGGFLPVDIIESALLAFAKLVLEREPSVTVLHEIWEESHGDIYFKRRKQCYRAMTAELLRELTEGETDGH